jgi:hypothetical protein
MVGMRVPAVAYGVARGSCMVAKVGMDTAGKPCSCCWGCSSGVQAVYTGFWPAVSAGDGANAPGASSAPADYFPKVTSVKGAHLALMQTCLHVTSCA